MRWTTGNSPARHTGCRSPTTSNHSQANIFPVCLRVSPLPHALAPGALSTNGRLITFAVFFRDTAACMVHGRLQDLPVFSPAPRHPLRGMLQRHSSVRPRTVSRARLHDYGPLPAVVFFTCVPRYPTSALSCETSEDEAGIFFWQLG